MKIFFLILLAPILCFAESIGTTIGVFGKVNVLRRGAQSTLDQGSSIYELDKIVTQKDSFIKIRFTDGTLLSVIPDSEYTIQNYKYKPDATSNNFSSNLAKGGLRFISGKIAKTNPDKYSFETPTATMGIRGTIGTIRIFEGVSYFGCDSGSLTIWNESGTYSIGPGLKYAYAEFSSSSQEPVFRARQPSELDQRLFFTPKANNCD